MAISNSLFAVHREAYFTQGVRATAGDALLFTGEADTAADLINDYRQLKQYFILLM